MACGEPYWAESRSQLVRGRNGVNQPIPVTVVGGYLGAGKTSLVNHVLRSADERIAVLVNDFGSVNIDASLIESADGDTITLANGCICCSLSDGYVSALQAISEVDPPPDRLLIEASGVSDPATVAAYAYTSQLTLDGVVLLIDMEQIERQLHDAYIGDVIARQIGQADIVVCNKADLVNENTQHRVTAVIAHHTDAPQISTSNGELALDVLFGHDPTQPVVETSDPASDYHESWEHKFDDPPTRAELDAWLSDLGPEVVRVKGFVQVADGEIMLVQRVGARTEVTMRAESSEQGEQSRLVGISLRTIE